MYGMNVATTRDVIEKLQAYEKENGIGAIVSIATHMAETEKMNFALKLLMTQLGIKFLPKTEDINL